jgi:membrane associated rhomboid family serine protease
MILPAGDDTPSHTLPMVTMCLIIANALALASVAIKVSLFALFPLATELQSLSPQNELDQLHRFYQEYAVIPAQYFSGNSGVVNLVVPIFTSMFLHGDLLHLGGNMWYLWIYGDNVEDRLGHGRFLLFYLLCGIVGTVVHILISPDSTRPTLGASGAIAGVLGAYTVLFPDAGVKTVIGHHGMFAEVKVPARLLLVSWFVIQVFYGIIWMVIPTGETGGVAWWAHIYGFVAGLALVYIFRRKGNKPAKSDHWPILYSNEK